jgi:hypothetical protein
MALSIRVRRYLRGEISGVRQYERLVQLVGCHTHRFLVSSFVLFMALPPSQNLCGALLLLFDMAC